MSTHTFPLADARKVAGIVAACFDAGRPPAVVLVTDGTLSITFVPDLTAQELATITDLVAAYGTILTLAEYRAIKDDVAGLRAYLGVASPTAAQTAAATKAIIRVLGTIIRE